MLEYLLFFGGGQDGDMFGMMFPLLLMVGVFFFFFRSQKKREKQAQEVRNTLEIGDEIVAAGGILGRVVSVRDDSVLIESGSANTKLRIARAAVQQNLSGQERSQEMHQEAVQAAAEAKARKKAERSGKRDKDSEE